MSLPRIEWLSPASFKPEHMRLKHNAKVKLKQSEDLLRLLNKSENRIVECKYLEYNSQNWRQNSGAQTIQTQQKQRERDDDDNVYKMHMAIRVLNVICLWTYNNCIANSTNVIYWFRITLDTANMSMSLFFHSNWSNDLH